MRKRLNDKNSQLIKTFCYTHRHALSHWFNFNYGSSCDVTMTSFNQILIANMGMIDTFACQTHFQAYVLLQSPAVKLDYRRHCHRHRWIFSFILTNSIDLISICVCMLLFWTCEWRKAVRELYWTMCTLYTVHVRNLFYNFLFLCFLCRAYTHIHAQFFATYVNSCVVSLSTLYKLRDV